jgi:RNA-directed DNA polymerase
MKDWEIVQTSLSGIAKKAERCPKHRFRNLYGMLNERFLRDSWNWMNRNAAGGVDGVRAGDFEKDLDANIKELVDELKTGKYKARLVRRKYIPKGQGKVRPLGIPVVRDKLVQQSAKRILQAIYEQDFMRCSYGYRPKMGARDAVSKLTVKLQFGNYHHVVDADIRGFFDNMDHDWLIRMLEERVDDKPFLRLIRKWLKAGILEEDKKRIVKPGSGSPQGGIISPVLANMYLHYAIDLWFHKVYLKRCNGEGCMIRYADDCVWAFECQEDAERFYDALKVRLRIFKLELSEGKSSIIKFNRHKPDDRFCFLGFEYYWSRDRKGRPHVKKRTSRNKLRASIRNVNEWLKKNRSLRLKELFRRLNSMLRGYFNYYGIIGNYNSIHEYHWHVVYYLRKWLSRRSQRGQISWTKMKSLTERFNLVGPSINERGGRRPVNTVCFY